MRSNVTGAVPIHKTISQPLDTCQQHLLLLGHDMDFEPSKMPEPTQWAPRTEEKVQVLRERLERGECLFHPEDATAESGHGTVPMRDGDRVGAGVVKVLSIPGTRQVRHKEMRDW